MNASRGLALLLLFSTFAGAEEIEQIEIEGIHSVPKSKIETALEVAPGETWELKKAERSLINLKAIYASYGYSEAQFTNRLDRNGVWKIDIREGRPTRLKQFIWTGLRTPEMTPENLQRNLNLKPGDIITREHIDDAKRKIENAINGRSYSDHPYRLQDVYLLPVGPPPEGVSSPPSLWANVEFLLVPTERLTFGFRGNERLTRTELSDLVEEQRSIGQDKALPERIKQKIEEQYRSLGYATVEVAVFSFEHPDERHFTYVIKEGPRVELESIRFDGNTSFAPAELERIFFENAPLLVQRGYYVEKDVQTAAEGMAEWMRSQGFLSARIVSIHQTYVEATRRMRVLVYLYEGDVTTVRSARISGATAFSTAEILAALHLSENTPLNLYTFTEGLERLKQMYRNKGHLSMQVQNENPTEGKTAVVAYSLNNRFADIQLDIEEGPQYLVGEIQIEGQEQTAPWIVRREMEFDEGDVLEESKLTESESNIRRLGIFSKIQFQLRDDPVRARTKQIRVILGEAAPGLLAGGLGVRNDLGLRVFGSLSYSNLWRQNHTWSLSGSLNRRFELFCRADAQEDPCFLEFQFRLGYVWPWFLINRLTFRPEVSVEKRRYIQFDSITTAVTTTLERNIPGIRGLSAALTYSLERTKQFNAASSIDNKTLTIGAITPSLKLDWRDDPLSPNSGVFASASYEIATAFLGSQADPFQVGYSKFQFRTDGFIPLASNLIWYLSFRTGYERNNIPSGSDGIPLIKQFALGGAGSLRGYKLQEINVQDVLILGSLAYVNYRTQLDFPITESLRFGPFADAGALMIDSFQLFPESMRFGIGFGIHYQTPIGPFNIDWGFKIAPKLGEDPNRIDVTIGLL